MDSQGQGGGQRRRISKDESAQVRPNEWGRLEILELEVKALRAALEALGGIHDITYAIQNGLGEVSRMLGPLAKLEALAPEHISQPLLGPQRQLLAAIQADVRRPEWAAINTGLTNGAHGPHPGGQPFSTLTGDSLP
jgi:hypothetical protein